MFKRCAKIGRRNNRHIGKNRIKVVQRNLNRYNCRGAICRERFGHTRDLSERTMGFQHIKSFEIGYPNPPVCAKQRTTGSTRSLSSGCLRLPRGIARNGAWTGPCPMSHSRQSQSRQPQPPARRAGGTTHTPSSLNPVMALCPTSDVSHPANRSAPG